MVEHILVKVCARCHRSSVNNRRYMDLDLVFRGPGLKPEEGRQHMNLVNKDDKSVINYGVLKLTNEPK